MRYIIIGAGAIGGTIGARLFESGHKVVLAARGPHYAALRDGGLRFATPAGTGTLPVPVVSEPGELSLRTGDVLILGVKTQDSAAALDAWAWRPVTRGSVAAESLPVFCAQNGVASERLALRRFRQVYGVCVWLHATHLEPGAIEAQGAPLSGLLPGGRYPAGADETARQVAADLTHSAFGREPVAVQLRRRRAARHHLVRHPRPQQRVHLGVQDGSAAGAAELARRARAEGAAGAHRSRHRLRERRRASRPPQ